MLDDLGDIDVVRIGRRSSPRLGATGPVGALAEELLAQFETEVPVDPGEVGATPPADPVSAEDAVLAVYRHAPFSGAGSEHLVNDLLRAAGRPADGVQIVGRVGGAGSVADARSQLLALLGEAGSAPGAITVGIYEPGGGELYYSVTGNPSDPPKGEPPNPKD